jgi:hypothetical protein
MMMFAGDGIVCGTQMLAGLGRAHALVVAWRDDAERLKEYFGFDQPARLIQRMANDLEAALRAEVDELLNLREAAHEAGYSEDHLGRLIREGRIPNAGRTNSPRIRRGDLPQKRGRGAATRSGRYDTSRLSQDIVASKIGG